MGGLYFHAIILPFMAKIKNWLLKDWPWLILLLAAVLFFLGTASFNYFTQKNDFVKWLSPDESANYAFAKLYAQEGRLAFFEKYNLVAGDIVHPRSFRSDYGWLKPVSFLGIILIYGKIASLTTYKILPYLTPFFAALLIIFYYLLIKEIFGKRNALIAALFLASFPPFIYYSARSMFHNVLFMVLAVAGFYFAVISVKKIKWYWADLLIGLAGALTGLAVMARGSELIWLIPAWLIIWLFNIKKAGLVKPVIFLAFVLFALGPLFYHNMILYGSFWQGGYNQMNRSILNMAGAGNALIKSGEIKNNLIQIKDNFFIFGLRPLSSLKMLYYYFAQMFYWLFWPAVLGFVLLLFKFRKWKKRHFAYFTALAAASAILILYYGSWNFYDNPDPKSFTIGNSYARYWLPIYLGAMPLAAIFLVKLSNLFKKKYLIYSGRALAIILVFAVSLKLVLTGSDEGLIKSAKNQLAARAELNQVVGLTENRAVIITRYHDKLFFPERKVIVGLFDDDNMVKEYATLIKYLPVYYYNFTFPEKDLNYLNNIRLPAFGLRISPAEKVTKDFTLYKLTPLIKGSPDRAGDLLNR